MKLNYNDIQYIIEQASKFLLNEDRMAMLPSLNPDSEEYEMYLIQNDNERKEDKRSQHLILRINGVEFEVKTLNNKSINSKSIIFKLVNELNTNEQIQENLLSMKNYDTQGKNFDNSPNGIANYFIHLLNTYKEFKTVITNRTLMLTKQVYPLNVIFNDDKTVMNIEKYTNNTNEKFKVIPFENHETIEPSTKWINRYMPNANGGEGGLLIDVLNSRNKYVRGWFEYEKGKRVEYINLSSFSAQVASYLKKGVTAKVQGSERYAPTIGSKINHGNVETPNVDWEKTKKDNGEVNRRYMTNSTDNQTIVANDKGELQGVKKGDRVVSGNVLGEQLAECMAYVISKKMGKNLCAILSIASSSDYNEKTMGDDYSQNKDNIIYHLRETFGVNNVLTDPKFFQKVSHLLEINRNILKSAKNQTEKNGICNNIKDAYQSKIEQYLKVLNKQKNSDELFKLLYCNMDENPNILDDLGFADLSFLKDTNYNVDLDNCQERMFGNLSIVSLYEDMVEADKKWEIKSIPENVKKYMSFFLKCSFDGTIKTITMIKNEIKDKTISPEDENAYFNAEDADKRGIVIFDDNYSSGATTKEAARVLVDFLNINPNRVLCVTPGYMASKK